MENSCCAYNSNKHGFLKETNDATRYKLRRLILRAKNKIQFSSDDYNECCLIREFLKQREIFNYELEESVVDKENVYIEAYIKRNFLWSNKQNRSQQM